MDFARRLEQRTIDRIDGPRSGAVLGSVRGDPATATATGSNGYTELSSACTVVRLWFMFDVAGAGFDDGRLK